MPSASPALALRRGGAARRRHRAARRSRPAAAATPTPCGAAGFDCVLLANGTEAQPHRRRERLGAQPRQDARGLRGDRRRGRGAGCGVSGRLKLRRGVVVARDPLTVEVDGERRRGLGRHGAARRDARGRRGRRQRRGARPRPRLGRLRRRPRQPHPRARAAARRAAGDARDEAQLHLAPAPGRAGRAAARAGGRTAARRGGCRSLVLPLHGHLAPAAWAAAQARARGCTDRLRADRPAGRCRARSRRDVAELRERGLLCGHITAAPCLRRRARGDQRRRRARRRRRPARLGRGPRRSRPRDHRLRHRARPRRHGGARHRPRGARPRPADPALAAALRRRPAASATAASATTPCTVLELLLAAVEVGPPARTGEARGRSQILAEAARLAPQAARGHGRPRRLRRRGAAARTMGRDLDEDPLFFAAPLAAGAALRRKGMSARPGEPPGMAIASQAGQTPISPAARAPAPMPASRAWSSTSSPTWSSSAASRATRSTPTAPTCSSTASSSPPTSRRADEAGRADVADFLAELADRQRPPAVLAPRRSTARPPACAPSTSHLRRDELIADDPTAALSAPRRAKKLPQVLNYAEVQALLASPRGDEPTTLRDRALLEVMYALRAARLGDDRAGGRPTSTCARASCAPAARARRSGSCRSAARRSPAIKRYLRGGRPKLVGERHEREAVRQLPRRAADPPGPLQDRPAPRARRRPRRPDEPAHPAPQLRHPPARRAAATCARCRRCSATPTSSTTQMYTHLSGERLKEVYFRAHPRGQRADAHGPRGRR